MRDAQLKIDALPPDRRDAAALLEFAQVQKERYIEKAQSENDSIFQRFITRDAEFLDAFKRAAEAGSAPAQYMYGILLTKIDPVSPDEQENKFFIHQILCSCMSDCSFDDENAQKGLEYVRRSVEQGFPPAELALGIFLLNGIGFENGKADPEAGFQQILKVAEAEKAEKDADEQNSNAFEDSDWTKFPACTIAGFCCALGVGTEPNEEKAFELLETSMGLESPAEMDVEVARRLKVGSAERLKWLLKAVQNGWESRSGYEKNELYYELAAGLIRGDRILRDDELAYRLLCELGSNGDDMILALRAVCCSMGWGTNQDETKAQALWASAVKKYREESAAFESSDDAALQQYFTILKANYCLCRGETELAGKLLLETNLLSARVLCLAAGWGVEKDEAQTVKIVRENFVQIQREIDKMNEQEREPEEVKTLVEPPTDAEIFEKIPELALTLEMTDSPQPLDELKNLWYEKAKQARSKNGTNTEENVAHLPKGHEMPVPWVRYSWKNGLFLNVESYGSRIVSPTEKFRVDEAETTEAEKVNEPLNLSEERFQQGLRYFNGQDVEKDETKGRALIEQAAKAGNAPAGSWLWLHNALDRLEKACETGDADALYERGALIRMVYLKELKDSDSSNSAEQYARFVEDFEQSAKKGNAAAQYEFAFVRLGLYPKRTEKNQFFAETPTETARTEALELLCQSAEKGFVPAMLASGIYALKSGDSAKVKDGFRWIQKAYEAGNETACEVLAFCFLTGLGTEPDETKALEALKKINDEFDTQKMYLFLLSKLIDDPRTGFHLLPWIDKAFEAGYDDSDGTLRNGIAIFLFFADEKNRDDARMVRVLNELNEEGLLDSEFLTLLSFCCAEGIGTEKDPVLAAELLEKSGYSPEDADETHSALVYLSATMYMLRRDFGKAGEAFLKFGLPEDEILVYAMGWSVPRDDEKALNLAREFMKTERAKKYLESVLITGTIIAQYSGGPTPNADDASDARVCEVIDAIIEQVSNTACLPFRETSNLGEPFRNRRIFWIEKAAELGSPVAKFVVSKIKETASEAPQNASEPPRSAPLPWIKYEWNSGGEPVLNNSDTTYSLWELEDAD